MAECFGSSVLPPAYEWYGLVYASSGNASCPDGQDVLAASTLPVDRRGSPGRGNPNLSSLRFRYGFNGHAGIRSARGGRMPVSCRRSLGLVSCPRLS